jgi:hypothetical protein
LQSRRLPPYCCSFAGYGRDGSARCGGRFRQRRWR